MSTITQRINDAIDVMAKMLGHLPYDHDAEIGVYDSRIQCNVIAYLPIDSRTLAIAAPRHNNADYVGVLEVAHHILPGVDLVLFANQGGDLYGYRKNGKKFEYFELS